jgi:photosystem II stability/assembly factor-like uncharacterized protein
MLKKDYFFFIRIQFSILAIIINSIKFIIMKKVLLSLGLVALSLNSFAQYSWTPQATKLDNGNYPKEIFAVDANTVWVTVGDGISTDGTTYPKTFSKTTNGGTTWTPGSISGPPANALVGDITALDANTAWVVTAPSANPAGSANGIWKTTNGGTTWARQGTTAAPYSSASFANLIYFWDANEGFTAGDPVGTSFQIFKTTNGGTTWTAVSGLPAPLSATEYGLTGVKYVRGNSVWWGTTRGRILRSADRGTTWAVSQSPALDFGSGDATAGVVGSSAQMAFKDSNNGLLIAVDNDIEAVLYATDDAGATWDPLEATGTWFYGGISYVPGTDNTYVTTGADSDAAQGTGSSYSRDGGLTWTIIDNIPGVDGGQRGAVEFVNSTTGWAGFFADTAQTEGIFKFSGNLSLAVNEASAKSNLKVYPNPAVDVVNITANKDIKSVTIYDLSGKKVKSSTDAATVNVSSLAKGTYIVQAYYGNGSVENTKLIKK